MLEKKVGDVNTQDDRNSGYAEILPSQQRDPWLNKMNFKLLRLRKILMICKKH